MIFGELGSDFRHSIWDRLSVANEINFALSLFNCQRFNLSFKFCDFIFWSKLFIFKDRNVSSSCDLNLEDQILVLVGIRIYFTSAQNNIIFCILRPFDLAAIWFRSEIVELGIICEWNWRLIPIFVLWIFSIL
jgi:hypothetical protein